MGAHRRTILVAAAVGVGTITLANPDSTILTGRWALVDLNPGYADNNVFLDGTFDAGAITGTWRWSTFIGTTAEGRFEMRMR